MIESSLFRIGLMTEAWSIEISSSMGLADSGLEIRCSKVWFSSVGFRSLPLRLPAAPIVVHPYISFTLSSIHTCRLWSPSSADWPCGRPSGDQSLRNRLLFISCKVLGIPSSFRLRVSLCSGITIPCALHFVNTVVTFLYKSYPLYTLIYIAYIEYKAIIVTYI